MEVKGRRYENGEPVRLTIEGRSIRSVEPVSPRVDVEHWPYVAPGLFDLQINGHGGCWFSSEDLTAEKVMEVLRPHYRFGLTRLCPTLVTNSCEALAAGFSAIREACERERWVDDLVPACHLEGPYISPEDGPRGAHRLEHVRPPDWSEFEKLQAASGNRIRLITLAPEVEGACDFIRRTVSTGVVVALGHTAANSDQIREAVDAGARLSTHLGNGAHATLRRHPNYIWDQLGDPRLTASIITDGHHLPQSVVRTIVATKSPHGTIITCDAAGLAGCSPGRYRDGSLEVEILDDGRIVVAGQRELLAGSSLSTDKCVANVMSFTGVTLQQACDMAGRNPAQRLGFEEIRLRRGSRADLTLFTYREPVNSLGVVATIAAGALRFGELPAL